jgi:hypothetical protein
MRLARFSVENYRAFVDFASVELRPLTLFFGYNSAGKSALVRLLPIIASSSSLDQTTPFALDTPAARGALFGDILSRQGSSPTLHLTLEWADRDERLSVAFDIRDIPERQLQVIERFRTSDLEAVWNASSSSLASRARDYEVTRAGVALGTVAIPFRGLLPALELLPAPSIDAALPAELDRACEALRGLRAQVHWLSSLRAVPARVPAFGAPPARLAHDGSNAGDFLAHDALADGQLVQGVSKVFERTTGHRLGVKRYALGGGEQRYSIVLTAVGSAPAVEIPVVDTGEGMAQLLPVVVLGCLAQLGRCPPSSIIAVEHPELHLHPAAHAELAAFFCAIAAREDAPTCVVETHSASVLLRVQIAIAKGDLPADRVIVHWVRPLEQGSVVDTITFDAAARPIGASWPPGVFSEDLMQARELLAIRKAKGFA